VLANANRRDRRNRWSRWTRGLAALVLAGSLAQAEGVPDPDPDRCTVRDLVLDPEGNVHVAYSGDRGIWRIDPAGNLTLHALIPEAGDDPAGGEILAMTLDPDTGDLHVRDTSALWRVTPAGEVSLLGEGPPAPREPEPGSPDAAPEAEGKLEARPGGVAPGRSGPIRRGGLLCMALLGLGALADPSCQAVSGWVTGPGPGAGPALPPDSNRYTADATAGLAKLGPVCAASLLATRPIAPCGQAYRTRVLAQVEAIHGQMLDLYVDPASLGPGRCQPGESLQGAKARIALDQSDVLVAYDALNADASALMSQLYRDGLTLDAVGQGLLAAQAAAAGGNATGLEAAATFAVRETATSLSVANQGLQAVGAIYSKVANVAIGYKAKYQRYANNQTQAVLDRCTGAAPAQGLPASATPGTGAGGSASLTSPVPALEDAVLKLTDGCVLASQHGLDLPVCSQASLAEVQLRNGTLGDLFRASPALPPGSCRAGSPSAPARPWPTPAPGATRSPSSTSSSAKSTRPRRMPPPAAAASGWPPGAWNSRSMARPWLEPPRWPMPCSVRQAPWPCWGTRRSPTPMNWRGSASCRADGWRR